MLGAWLGWITMRGDDRDIDSILTNPNRRTRLHLFRDETTLRAACGVVRPHDDDHLGLEREGARCQSCAKRA